MKIIPSSKIKSLNINPNTCIQWIKESFALKSQAQLPPKPSVHPKGIDFITTMPCLLPPQACGEQFFGVKVVHRLEDCKPSLGSDLLLYNAISGELIALMDSDWITTMRTGAVATVAIKTFRKSSLDSGDGQYAFIGLGNTARATLLCLLNAEPEIIHHVALRNYKEQVCLFIDRFKEFNNVKFTVYDNTEKMIAESDVIVSCITQATQNLCDNDNAFRPGCLVVPVHTRGFQNCDLTFDKVFADDTAHVSGFKYFNQFKSFEEIQNVIENNIAGRENDSERILSYNIGLGLHDVVFASKIFDMCKNDPTIQNIAWQKEIDKFWI